MVRYSRCEYIRAVDDCYLNSRIEYLRLPLCIWDSAAGQYGAGAALIVWVICLFLVRFESHSSN